MTYPNLWAHRTRVIWTRIVIVLLALAAWELLSKVSTLVASPQDSIPQLGKELASGSITDDFLSTMKAVGYGFVAAVIVGLPLGYVLGRSRLLSAAFDPVVASLFAIPRIIIYPLFLGILGVGTGAKSWVAAISAVFPIIIATTAAVRQVSPVLLRVAESLNCNPWQAAMKVVVPAALPPIMGGVRVAFGVSFVTVIIAELFVAGSGMGLAVKNAYSNLNLTVMYADIFFIVLIAFLGSLALWMLERRLQQSVG